MYPQLNFSFKDAIFGFDGQLTDIYIELSGDDLGDFIQKSHVVYTFYIYIYQER